MSEGQVIYTDEIGYLLWYPQQKALFHTYHPGHEEYTEEEFMEHIRNMTREVERFKPTGLIEDYATLRFVTSPQLQVEIVTYIKPVLAKIQLKRYAKLVKIGDVVAELLAEQIVDEARKVSKYVIPDKVFTDLEEALEWVDTANQ